MILRRILAPAAGHGGWLALGAAVAALAIIANIALVATSAYLVSRAQQVTNVADLALAITAVRVLAISRAAGRYVERLVIHSGTFRVLADLRAWCFGALEPLAPARLRTWRSGDLLARITADVATLEEAFAGVAVPPVAAGVAIAFGCVLLGVIDVPAALILLATAVVAGLVAPSVVRVASRRAAGDRIARRAETLAQALDEVRGIADLAALDRVASHRRRLLDLAAAMDAATARLTRVRAAHATATGIVTGLGAVAILAVGAAAVRDGTVPPVLLATLPLAALATFEAVGPARRDGPAPGRDRGGGRAAVRDHRHAARGRGPRGAGAASRRRVAGDPRPALPVRAGGTPRARRPLALAPGRRPARDRGPERRGQVDARRPAAALRGLRRGRDPAGRPRPAHAPRRRRAHPPGGRLAAGGPVRRDDPRQPRARRPRPHRRAGSRGARDRAARRPRVNAARGHRDAHRRGRPAPQRRGAAAPGDRARDRARGARPRPRRAGRRPGRGDGGPPVAVARARARRPDDPRPDAPGAARLGSPLSWRCSRAAGFETLDSSRPRDT